VKAKSDSSCERFAVSETFLSSPPFSPKAAENMPATTNAELINVFQNRFTRPQDTPKVAGIYRLNAKTVAFLSPNPLF